MAIGATAAFADGAKIFVIGGKPDDPFWSKVKKGADDAGKVAELTGGSVTWLGPQNYDNLGPDAAKLIRTALSQNPSAIVGPDWVPEAMDDAFKDVVAAGVPLIIYNSGGMDAAKRLGAMNYVGNEEYRGGSWRRRIFRQQRRQERAVRQYAAGRHQHGSPLQGHRRRHRQEWRQVWPAAAAIVKLRQPDRGCGSHQGRRAEGQHNRRSSSPSAPATPTAQPTPSRRPASATRSSSPRSTWTKPACSVSRTARSCSRSTSSPICRAISPCRCSMATSITASTCRQSRF